jgi:hypothetical protein
LNIGHQQARILENARIEALKDGLLHTSLPFPFHPIRVMDMPPLQLPYLKQMAFGEKGMENVFLQKSTVLLLFNLSDPVT